MKPQLATCFSTITLLAAMAGAPSVLAQSSEQKVQGYTPPPLFSAPPPSQPRPAGPVIVPGKVSDTPAAIYSPERQMPANAPDAPTYVKPRISRSREDKPIEVEPYIPKFPPMDPVPMEQTPRGRGMIVDRPAPPKSTPLPTHKPDRPEASPTAATDEGMTAPAAPPPAAPMMDAVPPSPAPAQKVTSKGVVTGPKTMPAAPTTAVESETVAAPTETQTAPAPEKTLMERHAEQAQGAEAARQSQTAVPDGFVPLAKAIPLSATSSQLSLSFTPGTTALDDAQRLTLVSQLINIMNNNAAARAQIQAFATPVDGTQTGSRRIALSRALAVRDALIAHGLEARRIDVRALGENPAGTPLDQVDIIVSGIDQNG
jgi:outer membrane protein OmpA-like peptidoglycan-associated protein